MSDGQADFSVERMAAGAARLSVPVLAARRHRSPLLLESTLVRDMNFQEQAKRVERTCRTPMAVFRCAALATAAYGAAVYVYSAPEIPRVSAALIVGSGLVGVVSGFLGLRLPSFLERARR